MDRSIISLNNTFLTMSDADNYMHIVCRCTKVPKEYKIEIKAQIIICMALWKVEVPTAM